MINKSVFSTMSVLFLACSSSTGDLHEKINEPAMTIPFQVKDISEIDLPDIVSKDPFIHLETHADALIGNINKVVQHGDSFYVLDGELETVEVFDERNQQILIFDLKGNYQRHFHLPFSAISFEKSGTGKYVFFRGNAYSQDPAYDHEIIYGDGRSFHPIKQLKNQRREIPKKGIGVTSLYSSIVLSRFEDEVRYLDFFSDTIYSIGGNKISNAIYLNMDKQSPQRIYGSKTNDEIFDQFVDNGLKGYIQTKHIVYEDHFKTVFSINYGNQGVFAVFDKTSQRTFHFQVVGEAKLGLKDYSFISNGVFPGENVLVCIIYAQDREAERLNYKEEKNPSLMLLDLQKLISFS